jgi:hypothetical protein
VQVSNEWFDSKLAYVGTGIDPGGDRTWFRPWGMTAIPMPAPCDKGFHKFAVADTYNHVIRIVNHWFAHGPNHPECAGPGLATTDAVLTGTFGTPTSPLLDHVWSVQVDPQDPDLLWLVARGSHTSKRGAIGSYRISTQAMTVDILSALPFSDEGVLKASFGKDVAATRAAVLRDGGQGTATLTLPEGADWSSDGLLIFVEGSGVNGSGTFVVRAFDRQTKTVTTVANLTRFANGRECVLHIDREGVVGPKDDILVGCWGQDTDHRLRRTGVKTWIVAPENNGRVVKPAMKPVECNTGPLDKCEWVNTYPWVFAPGTAALPCMFNASTAQFDARLICGRLPEQLAPDAVKHAAGVTAWRSPHGTTPPLALLCGTHGWGQLGDATCPQWPSLNLMNDADLATWLMQKGGLSVEEAANVAYVIRWNARY